MTTVLITLLAVVVALLVVLVAGLFRGQAHILRMLHDLSVDGGISASRRVREKAATRVDAEPEARRAADIVGTTIDGRSVEVSVVDAPCSTLLLFLTSSCTTCAELWRALGSPRELRALPETRVTVVVRGAEAESTAHLERIAPRGASVVMSTSAWVAYGIEVAPRFAFVGPRSDIVAVEGVVESWDAMAAACVAGAQRP